MIVRTVSSESVLNGVYFTMYGGPLGTVHELVFEKKGLIPAVQQMLNLHE